MALYTFQTINNFKGYGFNLRFTVDTTVAGLTIPPYPSMFVESPSREKISGMPQEGEIANVSFSVCDDFSVYPEGFWYKLLTADKEPTIKVDIDEVGTYEMLYWGTVIPESIEIEEPTTIGQGRMWQTRFETASYMKRAYENVSIASAITEILTHESAADAQGAKFVKLHEVLASIHKLAFGSSFTTADVVIRGDVFKWTPSDASADIIFSDVYMCSLLTTGPRNKYFDSTQNAFWGKRFTNSYDLFVQLCLEAGYVPRHYYDTGAGAHRIELITQGVTTVNAITPDGFLEKSTHYLQSEFSIRSIGSTQEIIEGSLVGAYVVGDVSGTANTVLSNDRAGTEIDLGVRCMFDKPSAYDSAGVTVSFSNEVYKLTAALNWRGINAKKYYNYTTAAFASAPFNTSLSEALVLYYYHRFRKAGAKRTVIRKYVGSIKATLSGGSSSTQNFKIGMQHSFSDGTTSRNFYAGEVIKDVNENSVEVVWNEI